MTAEAIPFFNLQESGQDELGGASPLAMNVITDAKGVVSRRPGIGASSAATSDVIESGGLDGIWITRTGAIYVVGSGAGERAIYLVDSVGTIALGGGVSPFGLRGARKPTFAETELLLVIAGGEEIQKVVLASSDAARLGGTPPVATHIISLNNRLLANDARTDRTKVRFSDVALGSSSYAGHEVWSLGGVGTSGYFTAESRPDDVVALAENTGEAFVFGQTTLQIFTADAELTFAPVSTIELGCSAPYSIIKMDSDFYWVDHKRRIVKSNGRGYEVISDPIQRSLDGIETATDAFGYHITLGFVDAFIWTFPSDGRSFVYQVGIGWGQWSGYSGGAWTRLQASDVCLSPIDGAAYVATTTGRVGEFSLDAVTDFGDSIVARVRTGYLNRGTDNQKLCKWVRVSLRRGTSASTPGPQGYLRWRDRPGAWTGEIPVDFGSSGDREIALTYYALGVYRYREWEFEFAGTGQLALVSVTEEFDVLPV